MTESTEYLLAKLERLHSSISDFLEELKWWIMENEKEEK